ncbi:MAG: DUF86 domain-containing protein [Bacteroidaceae bacterium]|nr:DUF86 domain-containing protein [Bacteroidaceae bacterium]
MREPVRDKGRLEHILDAIGNVEQFTDGYDYDSLLADKLHLHATVHNVQVIGEAVYKLSLEFKESHPDTPWPLIEKMRHILVHDYYQISFEILWDIIKKDIPELKKQIVLYLSKIQ